MCHFYKASESFVKNFDYPDSNVTHSLYVYIDPAYHIDNIKEVLFNAASTTDGIVEKPAPLIRFLGIIDFVAKYGMFYTIEHFDLKSSVEENLWKNIWIGLRQVGVFPLPQQQETSLSKTDSREFDIKQTDYTPTPLSVISQIPIFRKLPDNAKEQLAALVEKIAYAPGEPIIHEKDPSDAVYYIVDGLVGIYVAIEGGEHIEIKRLGAGLSFGEVGVILGTNSPGTFKAKKNTGIFKIKKKHIASLISDNPKYVDLFAEEMIRTQLSQDGMIESEDYELIKNEIQVNFDNVP